MKNMVLIIAMAALFSTDALALKKHKPKHQKETTEETSEPGLPEHVTTKQPNDSKHLVLDKANYDSPAISALPFGAAMECVLDNVNNQAVTLEGSQGGLGSWFGGGGKSNTSSSGGGDTIRFIDKESKTIFASGVTSFKRSLLTFYLKYNLKVSQAAEGPQLVFNKISVAQKDKGSGKNAGFMPVKTTGWGNEGVAKKIITVIDGVASELTSCAEDF